MVVLLALVLCAHLLVAWVSRNGLIQDDSESYVLLARNLVQGNGYVFEPGQVPTAWRAPGYVVLMSAVFRVAGESLMAVRVVHAFLWVLTTLFVYLLARKTVGPRAAFWAAGITGFYPEFLGFTGLIWSENLFICLFVAALYGLTFLREKRPLALYAGIGILLGAAILTRSTAVVLLPVIGFMVFYRGYKADTALRAGVVTVVTLLIVGSWTVRNWNLHHQFILVESNVGYNLYVGYRPDTPIPFAWKKLHTARHEDDYLGLVDGKTEGEQYATLKKAALEEIKARPLRSLALAVGKTFDFWLPDFFIARNIQSGAFGPGYSSFWIPVLILSVSTSLVVYLASLRFLLRKPAEWYIPVFLLLLALYTLPHSLVYGASRYRLPLIPVLILMAAPVLMNLYDRVRSQKTPA
ncbi:MAG: glycosyltransferase family 39 protein [Armatimonadetes bacterium]|nr:glycosyltransferase family 39 protein [Armatimonadota bacterium]